MTKTPRTDLHEMLKKQVSFLVASSRAFDSGFDEEGLRLAVTIRVLLHDTAASHSLLGQMGYREKMLYFDTAFEYSKRSVGAQSGLAMAKVSTGSAGHGSWVPRLDRPPIPDRWLGIRRWWLDDFVIRDSKGVTFNRRDLVLLAANQDGGAHVDPSLDDDYNALTRLNSMGWKYFSPQGEFDFVNGPALASIRMIAHELLISIQAHAPDAMGPVMVLERATAPDKPETVWAMRST
jgi:hypothetical protein